MEDFGSLYTVRGKLACGQVVVLMTPSALQCLLSDWSRPVAPCAPKRLSQQRPPGNDHDFWNGTKFLYNHAFYSFL